MENRNDSVFLKKGKKTTLKEGVLKKVAISMTKKRGVKISELYDNTIDEIKNSKK